MNGWNFPPKGHNSKSLSENNPKENKSDISDAYGQQCTSNHIAQAKQLSRD